MRKRRWLGWTGIVLCALYLTLTTRLVLAARASNDPRSIYTLMQLPVMLQAAALDAIGLGRWLVEESWLMIHLLIVPRILALLYGLGAMRGSLLEQ